MHQKSLACAIAAAVVFLPATQSRANCAAPTDYSINIDGNVVSVAPWNYEHRTCPDPDGMLRENVDTGEVVRLADYCQPTPSTHAEQAYVDECVAPGSYRYGLAKPYECAPSSCGTYYFVPATVTEPLQAECERSAGNAAPTPVASAPWTAERLICAYDPGPWAGDSHRDAGTILDAGGAEDAGESEATASSDDSESASGCSTSSSKTVFLFNALLVAAGLIGLRRSRPS